MSLRDPYIRRGETWQRAEGVAIKVEERRTGSELFDHPEMTELLRYQASEADALHAIHSEERIKLLLALRRERRAKD